MSVQDVFKKSFLEQLGNLGNGFAPEQIIHIAIALVISLLLGLFINLVYKKFYRGVVYNRNFSIALVGMTVLTAMVTLAISTNIVVSLGMVGALSIVRFRTAIKNPLDLVYLFWAITTGIAVGARAYPLALVAAVVVFLLLLVMTRKNQSARMYIAIVHYTGLTAADEIKVAMGRLNYRIKSKTLRGDTCELAMEVMAKGDSLAFADRLKMIEGVTDVTVVQYDGEYHD